jgi:hypothetical protein
MTNIGRYLLEVNDREENSFFLSTAQGHERKIGILSYHHMKYCVKKICMNEHRIFLLIKTNSKLLSTLEFDRQSMMIVGFHEGYSRVILSSESDNFILQDQ